MARFLYRFVMMTYRGCFGAATAAAAAAFLLTGCAGTTGAGDQVSPSESASTVASAPPPSTPNVASSPTPAVDPASAVCQDAITVALDREVGSGRAGYLVLTNSGSESCALTGYAEVVAVDGTGAKVTDIDRSDVNDLAGVAVDVAPGASAYASIFWDDSPETLEACEARVDAGALVVSVPGTSKAQVVETGPLQLCGGRGTILHLGPVDSEERPASLGY